MNISKRNLHEPDSYKLKSVTQLVGAQYLFHGWLTDQYSPPSVYRGLVPGTNPRLATRHKDPKIHRCSDP